MKCYTKDMYEYKVRRITRKRIKGYKRSITLNTLKISERVTEALINNESTDGWEFFFKDRNHFYFRRLKK